jgi:peptide/nickel transport system substrate-binding protein
LITKLHFRIELLVSHIKSKFLYILPVLILVILGFFFRNQLINFYNTPKFHTKIIGIQGMYTFENLPDFVTSKISYGLTVNTENDKTSLSPAVKSYELDNNNLDYTFNLNSNIYWQNGKKLTAYDINYDIEGLKLVPVSDSIIKISVEKPFAPLLSILTKPILKKNIGLGDYQIKSVTYKEGYVSSLKLIPIKKDKNTLIYRFYFNEQDITDAYKMGLVDEIQTDYLPPELSKWSKTKIVQEINTTERYSAIFLNTKILSSKSLRQALAYATPKTEDKNERCIGPISPVSWAYNPTIKEYAYSSTRAKELLKDNEIDKISLAVTDRKLLPQAEEIKNSWESILNIKTTITVENQIDLDNFEAVLSYGFIPHDPDQYLFWHSTQTKTNITKIDNSRIDKLLEEGRQTFDIQERKRIYQDFQKFLLEETPAIFLSYPTTFTISRLK